MTRPVRWTRTPDTDEHGRTGSVWTSECGRLRVADSGPNEAPFEILVKDKNEFRAPDTTPDAGFFPSLVRAKRALLAG